MRVGDASELTAGVARVIHFGRDARGMPRSAIVVRDPWSGELRAWANLCKHLPIPLDGGSGRVIAADGKHLVCGTHGAVYRVDHGYCVEGPCIGIRLDPLTLEEDDEGVLWVLYDPPAPKRIQSI
jgi:nitrite reductase/ring-hydroxylating ferredoxin subunit